MSATLRQRRPAFHSQCHLLPRKVVLPRRIAAQVLAEGCDNFRKGDGWPDGTVMVVWVFFLVLKDVLPRLRVLLGALDVRSRRHGKDRERLASQEVVQVGFGSVLDDLARFELELHETALPSHR